MFAGVMRTARSSPRTSTRIWRLRPLTFFSPVEPVRSANIRGLDTLAINAGGGGFRLAALRDTHGIAESIVPCFERALPRPLLVPLEHGRPGREVVGQVSPRHSGTRSISDCVQHLARGVLRLLHVRVPDWIRHVGLD